MNQFAKALSLQRVFSISQSRLYSTVEKVIVLKDEKEGVATVSLNKPPVNSLDGEFLTQLSNTLADIDRDESVKGVLLTSNFHGKVFSAGLNILDLFNKSDVHLDEFWTCVQQWFLDLYGFSKPLVASINGHAPAGGCAMALMTDYRVMLEGKTIGLNETQLGLVAPFFFTNIMTAAIGTRHSELALSLGTMFKSEEALKIGLVDQVCSADDIESVSRSKLSSLIKIPPLAFTTNKSFFHEPTLQYLRDNRKQDVATFVNAVQKPQTQAALAGYLQQLKKRS